MTREEAIKVIVKSDLFWCRPTEDEKMALYLAQIALEASLPEQPKRGKGKWIYCEDMCGVDGYRCDECGFHVPWDYKHKFIDYIKDYHFCPNCGADMRGEHDE